MYAIIHSQAVLDAALALCRGCYQRDILLGRQAFSGATLRGRAKTYSGRYRTSALSIIARCQAAGLPVWEETGSHGKRLVVVGYPASTETRLRA